MNESYITVLKKASDELTIVKSRFIGYAFPCTSENEALGFLQSVRDEHRGAKHHCYAYIIGENAGIMRYSDDGEPGGTAGLPIITVMQSAQLVNCCVVVVRYFGGVLLGTGGLVRAYTRAAQIALRAAGMAKMEYTQNFLCEVPYTVWDSLCHASKELPIRIDHPEFGAAISFILSVRQPDAASVQEELRKITGRRIEMILDHESFDPWEIGMEIF